ncbi:hypothetical protein NLM24_47400 [Nocardia zapadnayensis]|nr:hypothetical protein [Nocardia zapadnayensis]MCX0278044.1 hypothetical protein [Nocardia zapadnayensis]
MHRRTGLLLGGVVLAVLALLVSLLIVLDPELGTSPESAARRAAESLQEDAVAHGPWTDPQAAEREYAKVRAPLRTTRLLTPTVVDVLEVRSTGEASAQAVLHWGWTTDPESETGIPDWTYTSVLEVRKHRLSWQAEFVPAVVHPDLTGGHVFAVESAPAQRGQIHGAGDAVLTSTEAVVDVGIEPGRVEDLDEVVRVLEAELDVDPGPLRDRVESAAATAFVPVITLRERDYIDVAGAIRPIPGTVFRRSERSIPVRQGLGPLLLGRVGEATAEEIAAAPARVRPGELVGRGGLQEHYEEELAGSDGYTLSIATAPVDGESAPEEPAAEPLLTVDPVPGRPVRTTIDLAVQAAAEAALQDTGSPAALIAVDPGTGEIRAVANADGGFDRALRGGYSDGPHSLLVEALLEQRGEDPDDPGRRTRAAADLGMSGLDIGLPALSARTAGAGLTGSPIAAAAGASSVLAGGTSAPTLVTEAGGAPRRPAGTAGSLTAAEARALRPVLNRPVDTGATTWRIGETEHAGVGLLFVLVVESADRGEADRAAERFREQLG